MIDAAVAEVAAARREAWQKAADAVEPVLDLTGGAA